MKKHDESILPAGSISIYRLGRFPGKRAVVRTFLLLWLLLDLNGYFHDRYRHEKDSDNDEVKEAECVIVCHERAMGVMAQMVRWDGLGLGWLLFSCIK